jgi:hypothetical protein
MGKDSIDLWVTINKRPNFRTQRDSKIRAGNAGNSLGNRWSIRLSATRSRRAFTWLWQEARPLVNRALVCGDAQFKN